MLIKIFLPSSKYLWSAIVGGFLYATGFPILGSRFYFTFGPALGLCCLLYPLLKDKESQLKNWLWALLLFSFGLVLLGFYWIPQTLYEFGDVPIPVNYFLGFLFSAFLLPHFYFLLGLIYFLRKKINFEMNPWLNSALLAFCGAFLEMYVPQQFPAHLGHGWMALGPYLGLASYLGAGFYSCFNYFLVFSFLFLPGNMRNRLSLLGILLLFIGANFAFKRGGEGERKNLSVRIVQANIGNNLKISAEKGAKDSLDSVLALYQGLSLGPSSSPLDLIIWPETAYPLLLSGQSIMKGEISLPQIFQDILTESKTALLFGGYDQNPLVSPYDYFESEYNTAFLLSPDMKISNLYHKHLLIPFGEGLPFGPLNQPLSTILKNVSFFAAGTEYPLFETPKGQRFVTAICYEILFPRFLNRYISKVEKYPHFIVNITNDSWYGDTAEPYQHLFLAKWRALEFNIPLIRSTNTGITTVIYPDGREDGMLGIGTVGNLDKNVTYLEQTPTFYARHGIAPLWICFGAILFFLFFRRLFTILKAMLK